MENNKEELKEKGIVDEIKDTEILSFGYLINVILDYYCETGESDDPSEKWKKGTDLEAKEIPKDLDDMIKKAFKSQITKFIK